MSNYTTETILVLGASGQIGTELTSALRALYGSHHVVAADIRRPEGAAGADGPFLSLDATDGRAVHEAVRRTGARTIYHLPAVLSATGEQAPRRGWDLNMDSLLHVLDIARDDPKIRVFWPSSIAVFGAGIDRRLAAQDDAQLPATVYGISKSAGELWCQYYHRRYGVDVRSLRYPGLISHSAPPGGGTTDYAVSIFHAAVARQVFDCYLHPSRVLPMLYMPDAIRATLELMAAPAEDVLVRSAYNLQGMSFSPAELAHTISLQLPGFGVRYVPDHRDVIARSWPERVEDSPARANWGWRPRFGLEELVDDMLAVLLPQKAADAASSTVS